MEVNTQRRSAGLKDKIPDIEKTLEMVRYLKTKKVNEMKAAEYMPAHIWQPGSEPIETIFELNDTLYAKAKVPPTKDVYLWLGANVMLSYPIEDAETLLDGKLSTAKQNLANAEEDLDFLREQITVCWIMSSSFEMISVFPLIELADAILDYGSSYCASLQLGCGSKAKREGRNSR